MLPRSLYSFGVATRPALGIWHKIPGCESQARYCSENFTQPIRFVTTSGVPAEKGVQRVNLAFENQLRSCVRIIVSSAPVLSSRSWARSSPTAAVGGGRPL